MKFLTRFTALILSTLILSGCAARCYIKPEEQVTLYPGYAYKPTLNAPWQARVHGRIYQPQLNSSVQRSAIQSVIASLMLIPGMGTDIMAFETRIRPFLSKGQEGRKIPLEVSGNKVVLKPSQSDGHFEDLIPVPSDTMPGEDAHGWFTLTTTPCKEDTRTFAEPVRRIPPKGRSIICNIEDTIKDTQATNKDETVANTFYRKYRAVPGMADLLSRWQNEGAVFHYVSASPWQLYEPLSQFIRTNGFPAGTLHLKTLGLESATQSIQGALALVASLLASPVLYKTPIIEQLLMDFPERTFILVGDSSEEDAGIFAALAQNYPKQVQHIYIRNLDEKKTSGIKTILADVPAEKWTIFTSPSEIK